MTRSSTKKVANCKDWRLFLRLSVPWILAAVVLTALVLMTRLMRFPCPPARRPVCGMNLRRLRYAVTMYTFDYDRLPPSKGVGQFKHSWEQPVSPYVLGVDNATRWREAGSPFICPSDKHRPFKSSYLLNARVTADAIAPQGSSDDILLKESAPRHDGEAGYVFTDGHIKWLTPP